MLTYVNDDEPCSSTLPKYKIKKKKNQIWHISVLLLTLLLSSTSYFDYPSKTWLHLHVVYFFNLFCSFIVYCKFGVFYVDGNRVVFVCSRGVRTDVSLVPPIRQTASIFKQPVTVYKMLDSKVKHELKHGNQEKPKQLFWEKRLEVILIVSHQ